MKRLTKNILSNLLLFTVALGLYQACVPPTHAVEVEVPLTWTDNASNEEGFKVYFRADPALPFQVVDVIAVPDIEGYIHTVNVNGGETLQYQVTAYNTWLGAEQESGPSNIAEKVIVDNPGPPSSPSAAGVGPISVGSVGG